MRRQWLHLLQQCCQGSRCLHGSENNQSCDHIRHCTQLQPVVTRLSQVCKLAYNSGVQRAKHMCACCLANFLLHEPYQACQGPACQAWRHTHMMERRAKQALQSALPSGFWGMPPAPPQTTELEPWQIMQPPQPRSGDAPPPAGDLEPWQILQRPQRQQPESVWTAYGYSAGPPPPPPQGPPAKHWGTPPPHAGSMPFGLASSASSGPAAATSPPAAAAPATAPPRNEAMVLLNTIAQRLDELNAKVDYIAGQVQVLMHQSCQAV